MAFNYRICAAVLLMSLAAVSCGRWAPEQEQDLSKYALKGNVASIRTIPYSVDSLNGTRSIMASPDNKYAEFNREGMTTLLRTFNSKGKQTGETVSEYAPDGRILSSETRGASGELREREVYSYRGGRLYSTLQTDGDDSLRKYEEYEYFAPDSVRIAFSYKEGETAGYRLMIYDVDGNNVRTVTRSQSRQLSEFNIGYDSMGRRTVMDSDNILFGKLHSEMTYDENDLCSKMLIVGEKSTQTVRFRYELDSLGNWVTREAYHGNASWPDRIDEREIKYY